MLKFCDPHAFDFPYVKDVLDRAGIPSLLVELEEQIEQIRQETSQAKEENQQVIQQAQQTITEATQQAADDAAARALAEAQRIAAEASQQAEAAAQAAREASQAASDAAAQAALGLLDTLAPHLVQYRGTCGARLAGGVHDDVGLGIINQCNNQLEMHVCILL